LQKWPDPSFPPVMTLPAKKSVLDMDKKKTGIKE